MIKFIKTVYNQKNTKTVNTLKVLTLYVARNAIMSFLKTSNTEIQTRSVIKTSLAFYNRYKSTNRITKAALFYD